MKIREDMYSVLSEDLNKLKEEVNTLVNNLINSDQESNTNTFITNMQKSDVFIIDIRYIIPGIYDIIIDDFYNKPLDSTNRIWDYKPDGTRWDMEEVIQEYAIVSIKRNPKIALIARLQRSLITKELRQLITKVDDEKIPFNSQDFIPRILNIEIQTKHPVVINVDQVESIANNKQCDKIVGGPYKLNIKYLRQKRSSYDNSRTIDSTPALEVALASTASCFGINKTNKQFWIHPHTQSIDYGNIVTNRTSQQSKWDLFKQKCFNKYTYACLGEASPALYKAHQTGDIKTAIYAALTWLKSANSADAWGKYWKHFPRLADVNLDKSINTEDEDVTEGEVAHETIASIQTESNEAVLPSLSEIMQNNAAREIARVEAQLQQEAIAQAIAQEEEINNESTEDPAYCNCEYCVTTRQNLDSDNEQIENIGNQEYTTYAEISQQN